MRKLLEKIRKILKDRRTRQLLTRTVSVTAAIVVFVTTYALVLPAITMEKVAECGVEEHQHDDSCYTEKLICEIPESPGHQHTDECYSVSTVLVCQAREHIHSVENGCYDEDGNLICEIQEHTHSEDDGCYEEVRELICGLEESEGHMHDASCYQKVLTCGKEIHTHSTACYRIDAASTMSTEAAAVASTEFASLANTTSTAAEPAESTTMTESKESTPEVSSDDGLFDPADSASATTTSAEPTTTIDEGNYEFTADGSSTVMNSDGTAEFVDDGSSTDAVSTNKEANNSVTSSSTGSTTKAVAAGYVPVLDPLNFNVILNNRTGIYCCHPASDNALTDNDASDDVSFEDARSDNAAGDIEGTSDDRKTGTSTDTVIDSSTIPAEEWHRIPNNNEHDTEHGDTSELGESDLLRVYLAYTIPAGSLNETNTVAKYRLPGNIRLTDDQMNQINKTVNGISNQYVDMSTLEITDADQYNRYLGIEAVEGTRTPDRDVQDYLTDLERSGKDATEYISAVVRVEDVYNELTGENEGQDLIFTFAPYTVVKNQHEYDGNGQPIKAGEEVSGWVSLDLRTDQIEWETTGDSDNAEQNESKVEKTASIVFVEKNQKLGVEEIRTELKIIEKSIIDNETDNHTDDAEQTDGSVDKKDNYPAVSFNDSITVSAGVLSTDTKSTGLDVDDKTEITVHIEAEEDTFPEGTTMRLVAVTDDQMDAVVEAVEGVIAETGEASETEDSTKRTQGFHAVDISFWNTEGIEIEPLKPIRVSMTSDAIKKAVEDKSTAPILVHVDDGHTAAAGSENGIAANGTEILNEAADKTATAGKTTTTDTVNKPNEPEADEQKASGTTLNNTQALPSASIIETTAGDTTADNTDTLTFEAGSFSIYAIVYTVDLYWEVNGKKYDFSIPGGGFVSLEHLVEVLGIGVNNTDTENGTGKAHITAENVEAVKDDTQIPEKSSAAYSEAIKLNELKVSEATKKFVADVASVEFSSPELVWVGKIDTDTTVRELKEAKKLEVRYSGDLTVKEVAEINSQIVEAGDWALISVLPFENDETLTVTMKNGEKLMIKVTASGSYGNEKIQYSSADGDMIVTALAPVGVLPAGTKIKLQEIAPFEEIEKAAEEEMQLYANAVNTVTNLLTENGKSVIEARICDISFFNSDGEEIEPSSAVDISLDIGKKIELESEEKIGLAHITDDGEAEIINVDIEDNEAIFSSDAFSIYVVFKDNSTALSEPVYLEQGWVRIGGDYKKPDPNVLPSGVHTDDDQNGQKNYLRINLYTLRDERSQNSTTASDYSLTTTFEYLYGTGNVVLEDYAFNGRINMIEFTPADREMITSKYTDAGGIKTSYEAEQAFHNWTEEEWAVLPNVLNIYVNTTKPSSSVGTEYVVRYYHADGSFDEVTGTLTNNQNFGIEPNAHMRSNEAYSGLTISAGHSALSNVRTNLGTATINYTSGVSLVKANIYYKEDIQLKTAGTVAGEPEYDARIVNGNKIYDTSRPGLHTDKTATLTSNSNLQDGRTFDLTLETWNIGGSFANVGMVLDASGSMVWTSDTPTVLKLSDAEITALGLSKNTYLTTNQVNKILDKRYTDNSKLGYNGYKYYIHDNAKTVDEYVPLGYFDGTFINGYYRDEGSNGSHKYVFYASNEISFTYEPDGKNNLYSDSVPTAGWYYVNSSNATKYKAYGTAKTYCNYTSNQNNGKGTSAQFYIKSDGTLHCKWYRTVSGEGDNWESDVYVSANDADNKSEVLQNSIAQFAAMLNATSPASQISMTRFSRNGSGSDNFTSSQLSLLNWTNDPKTISAALNQMYGNGTAMNPATQNGLSVYNYGFTGQTSTQTGIKAFMEKLTNNVANQYTPTLNGTGASKYLIIFTDGKDTDGASVSGDAARYATNLKNAGYTIFTVLMQSAGMTPDEVTTSTTFLKALAGTQNSTTADKDKYFFTSMYDEPAALVENFQTIARKIAEPLEGYMIRDYIDPRFDIVDSTGNVLTRLNPQGQWSPRRITLSDGKTAILKYDSNKKMFYVEIEQQTIPTTPKNATGNVATVNTTTITVRAKPDFAGGEDILTNGNEPEQNSVFKPVDGYSTQTDAPTPADTNADRKDFPKTTSNPATLNITLSNYEDTIFLGETISPASLYENVQIKRDQAVDYRSVYLNYLIRAGQKFQNDPTYYVTMLKYGTVPEGAANTDPSKDKDGNPIEEFAFQSDSNGVITLTLPYYFLENPGDVTSYAGGNLHQADKVGKVTYSWKALTTGSHTLTDNNALKDYSSTTLDTVRYQLAINYKANAYDLTKVINSNGQIVGDSIANNGSVRTLRLTDQNGTDKLIKDPVGVGATPVIEQKTDTVTQGLAVIHVVAGKFRVIKRIEISDANWTKLVEKGGESGLTFTFRLKKDGLEYGQPFTINTNTAVKTVNGNYIELKSDWIDNLPKGSYTVEETGQPDGFSFMSVSIAAVTVDDADSSRTGGTPFAAPTTGTATWEIGSVDGGVPAATTYAATDFSAAKVKDTNKEVDPEKAKAYLNAQIGKGIVLNEPPKATDITLKKVDSNTGESIGGAKFALIKDSEYVDLEGFTITKLVSTEENPVVETITVGSNTNVKVVSVPKGGIKIEGLTDGTYILKEMAAPAGYVITNNDVEFTTENGSLKNHTDAEEGINFKVENESGTALPNTGGPGTTFIYLFGIMLTGLAGAGLVMRRRRKIA